MFDRTLRLLRELERGVNVSVRFPIDEKGYMDRRCPGEECGVEFKVLGEDWCSEKVKNEQAFCPFCRHEAPADRWHTRNQADYLKRVGVAHLKGMLDDALSADARSFNRRGGKLTSGGLIDISMRMEYRPAARPIMVSAAVAEALRQEFTCEKCACRWASLGASFFCPGCGYNSAASTFERTLDVVRRTVEALPKMRQVLGEMDDRETAEDMVRQVVEDQFSRLVGAFERLSEALFESLPNEGAHRRRGSAFQRIDGGSELWKAATGQGYEALLSKGELRTLRVGVQRRHLLTHRQGIVDEAYRERSVDSSYAVGQRLVMKERDVLELVEVLMKLASGLRGLTTRAETEGRAGA